MKDITGMKFGKLTAIRRIEKNRWNNWKWLFRCDCGVEKIISSGLVIGGKSRSCGCSHGALISAGKRRHGFASFKNPERFYKIWSGIKKRCLNEKSTTYHRYGGRGIKVCDRWLTFEAFRDDMHKAYLEHAALYGVKETTIDRINPNGNYEPGNCRWSTYKVQGNNTIKKYAK